MFDSVWKWAGQFRQSERNIGVCPWQISIQIKLLLDDIEYWKIHHTYTNDEIAIRFHQRFTLIHPFPNGNGRLARLLTDLLIVQLGNPFFTWGGKSLIQEISKDRKNYIDALREADKGDYTKLLSFARS